MQPKEQAIPAPPSGDCLRACLASIMELDMEFVPNFVGEDEADWLFQADCWLEHFGLGLVYIANAEYSDQAPSGYSVLCVDLDDGRKHCVVSLNGNIAWDPSPNRATNKVVLRRSWVVFTVLDASQTINNSASKAMLQDILENSPSRPASENNHKNVVELDSSKRRQCEARLRELEQHDQIHS